MRKTYIPFPVVCKCPECGGRVLDGMYGCYCENRCGMRVGHFYNVPLTVSDVLTLISGRSCTAVYKDKKFIVYPRIRKWKQGNRYSSEWEYETA